MAEDGAGDTGMVGTERCSWGEGTQRGHRGNCLGTGDTGMEGTRGSSWGQGTRPRLGHRDTLGDLGVGKGCGARPYLEPPPPRGTHGAIVPDDGEQGQPLGPGQRQVRGAVPRCHLHRPCGDTGRSVTPGHHPPPATLTPSCCHPLPPLSPWPPLVTPPATLTPSRCHPLPPLSPPATTRCPLGRPLSPLGHPHPLPLVTPCHHQ